MEPSDPVRTRPGRVSALLIHLWPSALFVVLLCFRLSPVATRVELIAYDSRFQARGPRPAAFSDLAIVDIDERTLATEAPGQWPLPRRCHAPMVDRLRAAGARAIVFDVFFVEPSRSPADDLAFVESVRRAGNVYLAGRVRNEPSAAPERIALGPAPPGGPRPRPGLELPTPDLLAACRGVGLVDVWADPDHTLRRVPLLQNHDGRLVPALATRLALDWQNLRPEQLQAGWGRELRLGDRRYPLSRIGTAALDFAGPGLHTRQGTVNASPFQHYSYLDIYRGDFPADALRGKIVLLGWTAKGLGGEDHFATPFDPMVPGVEIHATTLENLLGHGFFRSASTLANLAVLALFTVAAGLLFARLPILLGIGCAIVLGGGWYLLDLSLFTHRGLFVDLVTPLAGLAGVFAGQTAFRMAGEEQRQHMLRRAFEFYVAPEVLQRLLSSGEDVLSLDHAERREVTVLFADVIGFTTMSEQLEPEDVTKLINEYFTDLAAILLRYEAYLDKFMGDCVMAVFSAFPQAAYPDHALRAVTPARWWPATWAAGSRRSTA
ncbi:MAG: adenylate/guanylate cyclase domain-containing protein [Armatimonadetes bacterium]|nr:adenylate/guanylate cyclase domain-containing protein [Armatimonadota bacterium]